MKTLREGLWDPYIDIYDKKVIIDYFFNDTYEINFDDFINDLKVLKEVHNLDTFNFDYSEDSLSLEITRAATEEELEAEHTRQAASIARQREYELREYNRLKEKLGL